MEIEDKDQLPSLGHNHLVALILHQQLRSCDEWGCSRAFCQDSTFCAIQKMSPGGHLSGHILVVRGDEAESLVQMVHRSVKCIHEPAQQAHPSAHTTKVTCSPSAVRRLQGFRDSLVLEVWAVHQVPPPPALLQAATIACRGATSSALYCHSVSASAIALPAAYLEQSLPSTDRSCRPCRRHKALCHHF